MPTALYLPFRTMAYFVPRTPLVEGRFIPEMESVPNVSDPGTDLYANGEPVVVLSMAAPPLLCCRLSICFPAKSRPDLCFPSIPTYKLGRGLPDTSANQFYMPRLREIALLLI